MARVAIVIVTYNSEDEIEGCLDSLTAFEDLEIVVVDNASSDRTREKVSGKNIRLIANSRNAGFAAAVNQGVRATTARLLLLLNPDAHLQCGLDALAREFDDPKTGAAGGLLTGEDGAPQRGFMCRNLPSSTALIFEVLGINRLWPGNPVNWHYRCLSRDLKARGRAEQPAGALLMFSRVAWEKVGGFDERFHPLWFEDVNFCAALKQSGYFVFFNPAAVAKHTGAHSIRALPLEMREQYWYGSLLKYAAKYYSPPVCRVLCLAVASGAAFRAVLLAPREGWHAFAVYGAVCRLALGSFLRPGQSN